MIFSMGEQTMATFFFLEIFARRQGKTWKIGLTVFQFQSISILAMLSQKQKELYIYSFIKLLDKF